MYLAIVRFFWFPNFLVNRKPPALLLEIQGGGILFFCCRSEFELRCNWRGYQPNFKRKIKKKSLLKYSKFKRKKMSDTTASRFLLQCDFSSFFPFSSHFLCTKKKPIFRSSKSWFEEGRRKNCNVLKTKKRTPHLRPRLRGPAIERKRRNHSGSGACKSVRSRPTKSWCKEGWGKCFDTTA